MNDKTNQPSRRPLREGEKIEAGDEWQANRFLPLWLPAPRYLIGKKWNSDEHAPMRRPVKD